MKSRLSRRQILRALGGTGALSALGPLVPLLNGHANPLGFPKRLVIFATNTGMTGRYPDNWKPTGSGANYDFAPGSILEPLRPYREKLLVFQGIDMRSYADSPRVGGHPTGMVNMLTGIRGQDGNLFTGGGRDSGGWNGGASVDQFIAGQIKTNAPFGSLEHGVLVGGAEHLRNRMSYLGPASPIPPENNPHAIFQRVFAGVGGTSQEQERLRLQEKSVLDAVAADLRRVEARLATEDRHKLQAHLTAVRDVETRLNAPAQSCEAPALGATFDFQSQANIPRISELHMQLMVRAMACNLTRVTSILFGSAPISWRFPWLGRQLSSGFHRLSHASRSDTAAQDDLQRGARWFAGQFKLLLDMMSAVPEGSGTLLDNSVVLWTSENSLSYSHDWRNMPYVVAGSGGGYLRTGRFVEYNSVPHNQLLVTLCNAVGLTDVNTFGSTDYGRGPLAGLT